MRCLKCSGKVIDGVCIKCGYMQNGKNVSFNYDDKKTDLEIYEKDYDDMLHNRKLWKRYLLGTFYIGYKTHLLIGVILSFIELICFYFCFRFFSSFAFAFSNIFGLTFTFIIWIFMRLILTSVLNPFILYLDKRDIKRIKKSYSKNYKLILAYHKSSSPFLLFLNILFCIMFFVIFILIISCL